ncbi:MAG: pantetheine-phosphate adenylyltransferase [Erysipelotrichaceae bacterium]|nr:pantetheine-phosphate adenylyltransferase [Erysipelotrichaceae bacterium]
MRIAIYPGSFDPITIGHLDIIERSVKIFDKVVIAILVNPRKQPTFSASQRKVLIERSTAHLANVEVIVSESLTIEVAKKYGANVLIRGIRAVADYEYELQQATTNMILDENIETLFMVARPEYSFLSSSVAKELAQYHCDLTKILPSAIIDDVKAKFQ